MKIFKRLENIFSAIAFAEAGEHETARQLLKENEAQREAERREKSTQSGGHVDNVSHSPSKA